MAEKYTLIKVSNGKRKVFDYRWELRDMDFDFEKKAYGKSYYYKKYQLQDKDGINEIKAFCKKHKLAFDQVSSDYIRSDDYRKSFFHHNKGIGHGKYLCAYCGKIKKKDVITVDHIFPLKKTESNKKIQLIAKWFFG